MISTVMVEAHYSTNYVENYLDSVENLPDDVQRHLSRIREIDVLYQSHLRDVNLYCEQWNLNQSQNGTGAAPLAASPATSAAASPAPSSGAGPKSAPTETTPSSGTSTTEANNGLKRVATRIQKSLIAAQELNDEKLQIIQQLQDLIDHKTRQLDQDFVNLGNEFFARLDCSRDDKSIDGSRDGNGTSLIGGPGIATNNGPTPYGVVGNGPGIGSTNSGGATGTTIAGGIGSSVHILHTSNGTVVGASGGGATGTSGPVGGGNGSGMYTGNNGGNGGSSLSNERSSKRARRTRNEQTGGSANGSNTPNSLCGVSAMEVDPLEITIGVSSGSVGAGIGPGGGPSSSSGGIVCPPGSVTMSTTSGGPIVSGVIKQESSSSGMVISVGSGNGGNSGSGGPGISLSNLTVSVSGQTQVTVLGGNGSKNGNGGNGGTNNTNTGSGNGPSTGNGNGGNGGGPSSNISQLNNSNQGSGKKNTSTNNAGSGSGAGGANSGKKKKRKAGGRGSQATREAREDTPAAEETIDPDEPTYCLCDQISFGEMILCDNDLCPIEWFHFSCVSLISKPKGRWFCPNCRGDRPNVMKPKAQFLKELERYNKEKEEKT